MTSPAPAYLGRCSFLQVCLLCFRLQHLPVFVIPQLALVFGLARGSRHPPKWREMGKHQTITLPFSYTSLDQANDLISSIWCFSLLVYLWLLKTNDGQAGWILNRGDIHECLSLQQWLCPRLVWAAVSIVGNIIFPL